MGCTLRGAGNITRDLFVKTRQLQVGFPGSTLSFAPSVGSRVYGWDDAQLQRCSISDLSVCTGGEDALSVLTVTGEVLTLDMAMVQEREEKQADEIIGHSEEPVRLSGFVNADLRCV